MLPNLKMTWYDGAVDQSGKEVHVTKAIEAARSIAFIESKEASARGERVEHDKSHRLRSGSLANGVALVLSCLCGYCARYCPGDSGKRCASWQRSRCTVQAVSF